MVLCIRERFDVVELGAGNDNVESLWVRESQQSGNLGGGLVQTT